MYIMDQRRLILIKDNALLKVSTILFRMILLILGLALLTFTLAHYSPIDPVQAYLGAETHATPEQVAQVEEQWGLNKSMSEQFFHWIFSLVKGDFGMSRLYKAPVLDVVSGAFKNSLILMMTSWVLSGIVGYVLGTIAAFRAGKLADKIIKWYCYTLASIPSNVIGLIFLVVFGVILKIFPIGLSSPIGILSEDVTFAQRLHHFVLPCVTLSFLGIANVAMHTREEMLKVLDSEYILFAKARGESTWELFSHHCIRNTIIPVLMLQFSYFSELFGGSALAEIVFAYHGLGSVMTTAGLKGDLPLLLGTIVFSSLFVFFGNFIADILAKIVDPRIVEAAYE